MKVAIVGLSPTGREEIPWNTLEWEVWGLPWDAESPRMDRLFEMHDIRLLESEHSRRRPGYLETLRDCEVPLYMQDEYGKAMRYPFEDVASDTGAYWNSSIAYATALAIHEHAEQIAIYGVDMKGDDEYGYQKPNMEYLIGMARGMGIDVHIPEASPLCKFQPSGIMFYDHAPVYKDRYGWLG